MNFSRLIQKSLHLDKNKNNSFEANSLLVSDDVCIYYLKNNLKKSIATCVRKKCIPISCLPPGTFIVAGIKNNN